MNINDIITESQHACPHCGGPLMEYSDLMEKKDACYYKVKASAKVWPSAYASGRLVQCRKKGAGNYGNKSESVAEGSKDSAPKMGSKEKKLAQGALKGARDMSAVLGLVRGKDGVAKPPETKKPSVAEDKGMTQYNAFKREWRAKHGSDADVPGYDSKEYNAYWWRQGDKKQDNKKQGVSEGARQGEYGRVLTALGLYYPEKFSMEELNTPDWHRVIANKADVSVEYAGQVIDDFTQPDDDEYNDEQDLSTDQQFDMIEDMVEHLAKSHGVDSEQIWEDFESVDDHELFETAAWRRKEGKSARGGLNAKGVASYRRENPGSKLQTAVTTKPSKLKPGSKAAKRRKSFCARMGGVKGPMKKPNGKPTRKALALRKWNC